ncbi:MAG: hypothetical protein GY874_22980 [Desulfobacteraceae bacterium]|nr:hypothetical protein [Desulfobacteraceae bacterium]
MKPNKRPAELALWVSRTIETGINAGHDVLHYLETTFGSANLEHVLSTGSDGETESLIDLIFFPDKSIQAAYEQTWGKFVFSIPEQQQVIDHVNAGKLVATVSMPKHSGSPVSLKVPDFAIASFVHRLNITRKIPHSILTLVEKHYPQSRQTAIRVHLRNTAVNWHRTQTELMSQYMTKMPQTHQDYNTGLSLLLSLLWEQKTDEPPYDFLIRKKNYYFQILCKAEEFERKRMAGNMEILMLQGERNVYGQDKELKQSMKLIDKICQNLFGRTEFFTQPMNHYIQNSLDNTPAASIDTILKTIL